MEGCCRDLSLMGTGPKPLLLSEELLERARELRNQGMPWYRLALELGLKSEHPLRKRMDPDYAKRHYQYKLNSGKANDGVVGGAGAVKRVVPSPEMLAERDRIFALPQSLTASICGDPLPGRSALDKGRKKELV